MQLFFVVSLLLLIVCLPAAGCGRSDKTRTDAMREAKTNPESEVSAPQLPGEIRLPENPQFLITPPTGYSRSILKDTTGSNAKTMIEWSSPPRKDRTRHTILLIIGKERTDEMQITDHESFSESYLATKTTRLNDVQWARPEPLTIHSTTFKRVRWTGKDRDTSKKISGILIYSTIGKTDVIFDSEDQDPYQIDTMRIAESVASSFRSRSQK
jgi:hypothetical protein